jgi:hypothetical protein
LALGEFAARLEKARRVTRAKEFLTNLLTGQWVPSDTVFAKAALEGISKPTLLRASEGLVTKSSGWSDRKYRWRIEPKEAC